MKKPDSLLLASILLAAPAHAAVIAQYPFTSSSAVSTDTEMNSTASDFTVTATGDFGFSGAEGNAFARSKAITGTTDTAAVTHGNYFSFTVTPDSGQMFNLTSLTYTSIHNATATTAGAADTDVTMNFFVRSSVDSYAANVGSTFSQAWNTTTNNRTVDLSGASFQGLDGPVTFRLYVFESAEVDTNQGARWDDVILNGDLAVIPEPSTALLGGLGLLFLLRRRR